MSASIREPRVASAGLALLMTDAGTAVTLVAIISEVTRARAPLTRVFPQRLLLRWHDLTADLAVRVVLRVDIDV